MDVFSNSNIKKPENITLDDSTDSSTDDNVEDTSSESDESDASEEMNDSETEDKAADKGRIDPRKLARGECVLHLGQDNREYVKVDLSKSYGQDIYVETDDRRENVKELTDDVFKKFRYRLYDYDCRYDNERILKLKI